MCGIWGWVSKADKGPNLKRLAAIAEATEARGRDAFGFAWLDAEGRMRQFKQAGPISSHLAHLAWLKDARMIIGHCRYATHGSPGNNLNNHPFPVDSGWLVHNGVVRNHEDIRESLGRPAVTECDSEILANVIEESDGTHAERCAAAVACTLPDSPLAILGLWARPDRLIAVRRGNPVHLGEAEHGWYLGSLAKEMPSTVQQVRDGTGLEFIRDRKGNASMRSFKLAEYQALHEARSGAVALRGR